MGVEPQMDCTWTLKTVFNWNLDSEIEKHRKQWWHSRKSCKVHTIVSTTKVKNRNFQPLDKASMSLILIPTSSLYKEISMTCVVIISFYFLICPHLLVSYSCHNLLWCLKATEVCSLTVLESRNLKSKCWRGWFLPKPSRENSFYPLSLPLVAAGNHWNSLAWSCPPISASVFT